jgi:hypothetical protein
MNPKDTFALANWGRLGSRGVEIRPVIALPRTDKYQVFFGPYAWIDNYHGFQFCGWAQGRQFVDAGPLRGRHMWTLSETYSTKIDDWHTGFSYQTPLDFLNDRLRASVGLDYSLVDAGAKLNFTQELGPVFRQPKVVIDLGYRLLDLYDLSFRDSLAWDSARTSDIRLRVSHTYETRSFLGGQQLWLSRGLVFRDSTHGGNASYWKTSIEEVHTFRTSLNSGITLRAFAGAVSGNVPAQDQFYLSGGLAANSAEPVSWGYQGYSSGQDHWHYDADVNCRAWAGEYLHGPYAYGLNVYLQPAKFIQPFFDLGNFGDNLGQPDFFRPRMDAGIRLKLGPVYADFPIWRYQIGSGSHEFAFRWMLGLKMGGILGGS